MPDSETPVPFVQRVVKPDGRVYLYFRKDGRRQRLTAPEGSAELRAEVDAILASLAAAQRARTPKAGTLDGALAAYNRSAEFLALARSTQGEYQRLIDELSEDAGVVLLADIDATWVREMRDAWAARGHRAANVRLAVLANAFDEAIGDGRVKADPFARLKRAKRPHDAGEAHPIWEDAEVAAAIELARRRNAPGLARAIGLGRWGGFRRGYHLRHTARRPRFRRGRRALRAATTGRPRSARCCATSPRMRASRACWPRPRTGR
jgi:hypothetical protein